MGKSNKKHVGTEHFTLMHRSTMGCEAWRALPTAAQALYPWLKLEWKGDKFNNNGEIRLSVRQAAQRMGVSVNTAARAFHELQAKGFIVVTKSAVLGLDGKGKSTSYEITDIGMPKLDNTRPRKLFRSWKPGQDFKIVKSMANNPEGRNGEFKNPSSKL